MGRREELLLTQVRDLVAGWAVAPFWVATTVPCGMEACAMDLRILTSFNFPVFLWGKWPAYFPIGWIINLINCLSHLIISFNWSFHFVFFVGTFKRVMKALAPHFLLLLWEPKGGEKMEGRESNIFFNKGEFYEHILHSCFLFIRIMYLLESLHNKEHSLITYSPLCIPQPSPQPASYSSFSLNLLPLVLNLQLQQQRAWRQELNIP